MFTTATCFRGATALGVALALVAPAGEAQAQTAVQFNGIVIQSCIMTVSTPGVLGVSTSSGTELGSELTGGTASVLGVVATAGAPTIQFSAPTMTTKPAAYAGSPVVSVSYTSTGGANQAYTTGTSQYTSTNPLTDTITINAKADDAAGFPAGNYQLQTTATCQQ